MDDLYKSTISRLLELIISCDSHCENCSYRHYDEDTNTYYCYFASECINNDYEYKA